MTDQKNNDEETIRDLLADPFLRGMLFGSVMTFVIASLMIILMGCTPEPRPTLQPISTIQSTLPELTAEEATAVPITTPTAAPTAEPTALPTAEPTVEPVSYLYVVVTADTALHEVCRKKTGEFQFNKKGLPVISECFFSINGLVDGRIKYLEGEQLFIYKDGDQQFKDIYGDYTLHGRARINSDGANCYHMVAGPRGNGLFIGCKDVEILGNSLSTSGL